MFYRSAEHSLVNCNKIVSRALALGGCIFCKSMPRALQRLLLSLSLSLSSFFPTTQESLTSLTQSQMYICWSGRCENLSLSDASNWNDKTCLGGKILHSCPKNCTQNNWHHISLIQKKKIKQMLELFYSRKRISFGGWSGCGERRKGLWHQFIF